MSFHCLRFSQAVKAKRKKKQATLFETIHTYTNCCSFSSLRKNWLYIQKNGYSTLKLYLTQEFLESTHTVDPSLCIAVSKSFIQNFIQTFNRRIYECDNDYSFGTLPFLSLPSMVKIYTVKYLLNHLQGIMIRWDLSTWQ